MATPAPALTLPDARVFVRRPRLAALAAAIAVLLGVVAVQDSASLVVIPLAAVTALLLGLAA